MSEIDLEKQVKVYTLEEVRDLLKVTQRTLYNYISTGKLKATKIGKYWRVRHVDLAEFVEKGSNTPQ